jgi:hypothetical protein
VKSPVTCREALLVVPFWFFTDAVMVLLPSTSA